MSSNVIYHKVKLFQKKSCSIELTIVEHCDFDVLEVICYSPSNGVEADRLYLRYSAVQSRYDLDDIRADLKNLRDSMLLLSVIKFVEDRLQLIHFNLEKKILQVKFRDESFSSPSLKVHSEFRMMKPSALVPFFMNRVGREDETATASRSWCESTSAVGDFTPHLSVKNTSFAISAQDSSDYSAGLSGGNGGNTNHPPSRSTAPSPCPSPRPSPATSLKPSRVVAEARKKAKSSSAHFHVGISATAHRHEPKGHNKKSVHLKHDLSTGTGGIGDKVHFAQRLSQKVADLAARAGSAVLQGLGVSAPQHRRHRHKVHAALDPDCSTGLRLYTSTSRSGLSKSSHADTCSWQGDLSLGSLSSSSLVRKHKAEKVDNTALNYFSMRGFNSAKPTKSILLG